MRIGGVRPATGEDLAAALEACPPAEGHQRAGQSGDALRAVFR